MRNLASLSAPRWAVAAVASLLCLAAYPGGTLEGRWKLVEQRRGSDTANLASSEAPVRLEFSLAGGKLQGRIWAGTDRNDSQPWPAMQTEQGPVRVEVRELTIAPAARRARAAYLVKPSKAGGESLEIVEEYSLSEDGQSLAGTVTVTSSGAGVGKGSYTMHRRFERER